MRPSAAGATVFFTSAAVLVLEILAARLLAPYFGTSLETFTAIVGIVLAGIATGTFLGGRVADAGDPARAIGLELAGGGLLTLAVVPILRALGPALSPAGGAGLVSLALLALFAPAAVLSAVPPAVARLVLRDLGYTGRVVGRLSGLGTAGAILGTFLTGFVLVGALPSPVIVAGLGVALLVWGVVRLVVDGQRPIPLAVAGLVLAGLGPALPAPCDAETSYACATVEEDPANPSGRYLVLDTVDNSYVDLEDPTHLRFTYTRMFAAVADAHTEGPLRAVHLGGGGFSMPRWLSAERPGSESVVLEIDPELVRLARERLGLVEGEGLEVVLGDARRTLRTVPDDSADLVLGDAFSGLTVPWHLVTVEATRDVARVLSPGGVYAVNLIDHGDLEFVRSATATLARVFPEVAVLTLPERLDTGGNFVVFASDSPLDPDSTLAETAARGLDAVVLTGPELGRFVGTAMVLTDDHAPVDQLRT